MSVGPVISSMVYAKGMSASLDLKNDVLHQDSDALVTPSWLTVGGSSYAIRTVVRLDYRVYKPPTNIATFVFCCALVLICVCLWYLFRDIVPAPLAWALLIASSTLMLYAAWYAFAVKPHYQVLVALLNGSSIRIRRHKREHAEGLHRGLTEAMDWHIGGEILINADIHDSEGSSQDSPNWQVPVSAENKRLADSSDTKTISSSKVSQVLPFLAILHQKRRN